MSENVVEFYKTLGFEEAEIEDGLTAFTYEVDPEKNYVLLTDEEGLMPATLKQELLFSCYSPEGSFQWSTSFKNSHIFKELWSQAQTPAQRLDIVRQYRESKDWYK